MYDYKSYYKRRWQEIKAKRNADPEFDKQYRDRRSKIQNQYYAKHSDVCLERVASWRESNTDKVREMGKVYYHTNEEQRKKSNVRSMDLYLKDCSSTDGRLKRMITNAKLRAKRAGVPFDISAKDLSLPEKCPVLGTKLKFGSKDWKEKPSLDRIDPKKGYVKGNVCIISWEANRLKNNLTLETINRLRDYIISHASKGGASDV